LFGVFAGQAKPSLFWLVLFIRWLQGLLNSNIGIARAMMGELTIRTTNAFLADQHMQDTGTNACKHYYS
jgi:hypothetical protein